MTFNTARLAATWVVAVALGLAGCGGSTTTPSGSAPSVTTTATRGSSAATRPTIESTLPEVQDFLVTEARSALRKPSFSERNTQMARAVGLESAILSARSIGEADAADKLERVFTQASVDAGNAFAGAFDRSGNRQPGKEADYKNAMDDAGEIAYGYLPRALEASGIYVNINDILRRADFNDVVRLTARQLGVSAPQTLDPDQVRQSLHETARDDYFEGQIDRLPFSDKHPLSQLEEKALDIAVRLANTTWKAGQVHRAAWEGNDSRIDPAQREAFNPYDVLKRDQYKRILQSYSPQDALVRVGLEVYKDKLQYDQWSRNALLNMRSVPR